MDKEKVDQVLKVTARLDILDILLEKFEECRNIVKDDRATYLKVGLEDDLRVCDSVYISIDNTFLAIVIEGAFTGILDELTKIRERIQKELEEL